MNKNVIIGMIGFVCLVIEFYCLIKQGKLRGGENIIERKLYVNTMCMVCAIGMIIMLVLDKIL